MKLSGILNFDKPGNISSARIVSRIKFLLPKRTKIGHAGTLDPFATGVLLLLVGSSTKLCERLMDEPKQYEATIKLGSTTPTDDPESGEIPTESAEPVSIESVREALTQFKGDISQRPPPFSALKIGGQPAYKLARAGQMVELKSRIVRVYGLELLNYEWPLVSLRVDCGRGFYVRALARDLGESLGVGGHLTQLRRTRVGPFFANESVGLEQVQSDGVETLLRQYPQYPL